MKDEHDKNIYIPTLDLVLSLQIMTSMNRLPGPGVLLIGQVLNL